MDSAENNAESLLVRARRAAKRAHCPYSNFHVGAAVRCDDGSVIEGCNVENASYGLSICAERVALFTAISQGKQPMELAVSCIDGVGTRQVEQLLPAPFELKQPNTN